MVPFIWGGTSLLLSVGEVAMDFVWDQFEAFIECQFV